MTSLSSTILTEVQQEIRLPFWTLPESKDKSEVIKSIQNKLWMPSDYVPTVKRVKIKDIEMTDVHRLIGSIINCRVLYGFYDLSQVHPYLMFVEEDIGIELGELVVRFRSKFPAVV